MFRTFLSVVCIGVVSAVIIIEKTINPEVFSLKAITKVGFTVYNTGQSILSNIEVKDISFNSTTFEILKTPETIATLEPNEKAHVEYHLIPRVLGVHSDKPAIVTFFREGVQNHGFSSSFGDMEIIGFSKYNMTYVDHSQEWFYYFAFSFMCAIAPLVLFIPLLEYTYNQSCKH
ncbi:hypothetical protein O9G_001703 [Rozella allomycis CSF55]|uniref:Translocon-associated protein subunit beta n=1 Tax=Rozella allomycis (strain CSF55) TaxID=988480 RepID=A0A075ASM9_ROZAC|nr:hypothetical protein O9G_001703 [Rozella allomycis CSF55]|eukprot:EPZ33291.1 hypothetical protein O9G_001703 [Rozella allomycis CSF55]